MNSGLILAGDKPDIAGGVFRANEQAFAQGQRNRENALQTFMRDQGGALYNGDGNAMQQYAQFDPQAAVGMRNAEEARQRARQAAARAAAAASRRNAAAASAQENEALQTAFRVMGEARAQGPEVFAATAQQFGYSDEMARYNITFDNFDQASRIVNAEMGWEQPQPAALPEVNFDIPDGYMLSDPQNPRAGVVPIQGIQPAAPEVSIREDVNGISRYVGGPQHGQQVFEGVSPTPEAPAESSLEEKIRLLMEQGATEEEAVNISAGRWVVSINPATNERIVLDKATGQPINRNGAAPATLVGGEASPVETAPSIPDIDYSTAFGAPAVVGNLANSVTDFLGMGQVAPQAADATRILENLQNETILVLSQSMSGRDTNQVRDLIKGMTITPSEVGGGVGDAQNRAVALQRMLQQQLSNQQAIIQGESTPAQVQAARVNARNLEALIANYRIVGQSLGGQSMGQTPPPSNQNQGITPEVRSLWASPSFQARIGDNDPEDIWNRLDPDIQALLLKQNGGQ